MSDLCPPCGRRLVAGLRYGRTPEPVAVEVCLHCGYEDPPLPCCGSNVHCRRCEAPLTAEQVRVGNRHCSRVCGALGPVARLACPCGVTLTLPRWLLRRGRMYCSTACGIRFKRLRRAS